MVPALRVSTVPSEMWDNKIEVDTPLGVEWIGVGVSHVCGSSFTG
jgi:hypothetical protein